MSDDSMAPRWLSPDAPTITNSQGGSQSDTRYAFTELDPHAMFVLTEILHTGRAKYGPSNWRKISVEDHINHALVHINAYMAGDNQDDHLGHAFCRMMFAVALDEAPISAKHKPAYEELIRYCRTGYCSGNCIEACCKPSSALKCMCGPQV